MALMDVFLDEIRDLYSAENQLVKALPKLSKGAKDPQLKTLFADHLEETKGHVERLKQIFEMLDEKPTGKHCNGMEGLIEEGDEALEEDAEGPSFDLGLTGGAVRVEHYEIAGYSAVIAMANTLSLSDAANLLSATLKEEETAAKKITALSDPLMKAAAKQPAEEKKPMDGKEKYAARLSKEDEEAAAPELKKHKATAAA
ncbi:Ferritin-like metal-binding protein YciE [Bryocella elongata]|uniref:Ferritin-like metal-binding protein YciE n=1 Tax=Bryocella elongata TaxID=863522 RepID=A0A1H6AMP1_9BACT|nr:ferritin-like domain-containing protein [Bryocella elongata]SEG50003.1 Ferritin-like metal-binding protein YciE [Bryocella elongata]